MKRATDLYPMQVNPWNFQRGDVVKKIYTDKIVTPYSGVVTSIVPSTNKVEVQWPYGNGIEDPWDLIKVNPLLFPPVVNQDKAYKTYQNQLSHDYFEKLQPHHVLKSYLDNEFNPLILTASNCYNKGFDKKTAFKVLSKETDNKEMILTAVEKVYNDNVKFNMAINSPKGKVNMNLEGDSDHGYTLVIEKDGERKDFHYNALQQAVKSFKKFEEIVKNLSNTDNESDNEKAVKEASKKILKKEE